jgi:DNA polymerase elongation subunit (family B)
MNFEFQAIAWHAEDVTQDDDDSTYVIKAFGRTLEGKTVGVTVTNFKPFFYVKINPEWETNSFMTKIFKHLKSLIGENISIELVKRKDFWGFTNKKIFHFFKIEFPHIKIMKQAIIKLCKIQNISGLGKHKFDLYESNFEPFLRFIHIRKLLPMGWIRINKYHSSTEMLESNCEIDIECNWKSVEPINRTVTAPFLVASFDLECTSSGGEFPVPVKTYRHFATQLYDIYNNLEDSGMSEYKQKEIIIQCIAYALCLQDSCSYLISKVHTKKKLNEANITPMLEGAIDDVFAILRGKGLTSTKDEKVSSLSRYLTKLFGPLEGDSIIQIGTTFHKYGSKEVFYKHIVTLGSCDPIEGVVVDAHDCERKLMIAWRDMMVKMNPDIVTGYNIFGFDFDYLHERAIEIGISSEFMKLSRLQSTKCGFKKQMLSSSALGDNILKYIAMEGRVLVDLMKVVQRDHKLDSYKLDNVAYHFTGDRKDDVSPKEIFELQKGTAADRARIAAYCIQDCALCNNLMIKLEIVANNMGMANVCLVPMEYIFMRGQGIKIFSLVLNECRNDKYVIPLLKRSISVRKETVDKLLETTSKEFHGKFLSEIKEIEKVLRDETRFEGPSYSNCTTAIILSAAKRVSGMPIMPIDAAIKSAYPYSNTRVVHELSTIITEALESENKTEDESDSYEGAIVLQPKQAIYIDKPVSVLDYASLYPSSMISENLSHDCLVIDPVYDNLPGVEYLNITYDIYMPGTKDVIGERVCRYVQGEKGIIPRILMKLLGARKLTRKRMGYSQYNGAIGSYADGKLMSEDGIEVVVDDPSQLKPAYDEFELAVMDGLQVAYKVTANSLYGQIGAKTSQIYLKDIAACTTATGRKMILTAKEFLESQYAIDCVYGDTDSLFVTFPTEEKGHAAIMPSIRLALQASKDIKVILKNPHDLEYEKTFWPFVLLSKKRYVGNAYGKDDKKFKQQSMGIVLKRRDNAGIVKELYGGVIDIILNKQDLNLSIEFLKDGLSKLINGEVSLDSLVISKSLKADYKAPTKIAHKVLAERIAERDPGNKPQINDRIPYIYIKSDDLHVLQGDRIETPEYVKQNNLKIDIGFYITNQIMKPILQVYALEAEKIPGFVEMYPSDYLSNIRKNLELELKDRQRVDDKFDEISSLVVQALIFNPILRNIENIKLKKSLLIKKYYRDPLGDTKPKKPTKAKKTPVDTVGDEAAETAIPTKKPRATKSKKVNPPTLPLS